MDPISVTFVQPDGEEKTITTADEGESLMELARANGVDGIIGECGGGCACATCHVYVDSDWQEVVGEADELEDMTLDMLADIRQSNSRLTCQILVRPELDGLRLTVAPAAG